jgi:hypothetical protein
LLALSDRVVAHGSDLRTELDRRYGNGRHANIPGLSPFAGTGLGRGRFPGQPL